MDETNRKWTQRWLFDQWPCLDYLTIWPCFVLPCWTVSNQKNRLGVKHCAWAEPGKKIHLHFVLWFFYGCFVQRICAYVLSPKVSVAPAWQTRLVLVKYFKRVSVWWLMIWQRWYFLWELVGTFVQLSQYLAFLARSFQLHMFPHSYQRRSLISRLPKIFHIINYHFSKLNSFRNHQDWHPSSPPPHHYHPHPHNAGYVCLNLTTRLCLKNLRRKFTARPTPLRQTMIKMALMIKGRFWITFSLFSLI